MTSLPDEFATLFPQPSPELLARLAELDTMPDLVDALHARIATVEGVAAYDRNTLDNHITNLDAAVNADFNTLGGRILDLVARIDALGDLTGPRGPAGADGAPGRDGDPGAPADTAKLDELRNLLNSVSTKVARLDAQLNPPPPVGPSGIPMPTIDPAGHTRVFADDFTAYPNVPVGQFPAATNGQWSGYPNHYIDTSKNGHYNLGKTCSIVDGVLDIHLWSETVNGAQYNYSAAPYPMIPGNQPTGVINGVDFTGQPVRANLYYGQIEFAFRCAQPAVGWKTAWLLWPDKGTNILDAFGKPGGYGEIDIVEGNLDGVGKIEMFHHRDGATIGKDQDQRSTGVQYADPAHTWHIAKLKWAPNLCEFYLDDVKQGASITSRVDRMPMHLVFQTETRLSGGPPPAGSQGRMQIDWVVIHQLDGIYPA